MIFVVAVTALVAMGAANALAIATLVSSSWQVSLASVARRRRHCQVALYSVPAVVVGKYLALVYFGPRSNVPLSAALASLVVTSALPLLARNKAARVLEGLEIRELLAVEKP